MNALLNQLKATSEKRIAASQRERNLIDHIRGLQKTLQTVSGFVPEDVSSLIAQTVRQSKEVVAIAEAPEYFDIDPMVEPIGEVR